MKSRPVNGTVDSLGHANDWTNLSTGLRTLQYYSVGVGADPERGGYAVFGGLQDNGGALLRGDRKDNSGHTEMVSPFGGDGGDSIVDPRNGCHILDEYVYLELWMTTNCGQTDGTRSAIIDVGVPDANPRFTAPFRVVRGSENTGDHASERWVAGGNAVWTHDLGFSTTEEQAESLANHGWTKRATLGTGGRMVVGLDAVASTSAPRDATKDVVVAAWCGESNCNSTGFTRGVQTNFGGSWHELDMTGLPNRFPNQVYIDSVTADTATVYLAFNGYNRRFIEGPGAAQDHLWKGVLTQVGWRDLDQPVRRHAGRARSPTSSGRAASSSSARTTASSSAPSGAPATSPVGSASAASPAPRVRCRSPPCSTSRWHPTATSTPRPTAAASGGFR